MKEPYCGPCGIYCGACGATDCGGCRSADTDDWVPNCAFRRCAEKKQVSFCCFCPDYACPPLKAFMTDEWPHHRTARPNLEFIRSHGVEKWLQAQRQEWSCPSCGADIKWYQRQCSCGKELDAWDLPAQSASLSDD